MGQRIPDLNKSYQAVRRNREGGHLQNRQQSQNQDVTGDQLHRHKVLHVAGHLSKRKRHEGTTSKLPTHQSPLHGCPLKEKSGFLRLPLKQEEPVGKGGAVHEIC